MRFFDCSAAAEASEGSSDERRILMPWAVVAVYGVCRKIARPRSLEAVLVFPASFPPRPS
eukprot:scaffold6451_cov23-Attheya_sp.AAC.1